MQGESAAGAECPRCGGTLGGARWCPTCGLDTTPEASSLPTSELYDAIRREVAWLQANPGHGPVTSAVPLQPDRPREEVDHARVPSAEQLTTFRPIERSATLTVWLLGAGIAVALVGVLNDIERIQLFGDLVSGRPVSQPTLEASDSRRDVVSALQFLFFVLTAIFFIRWFHRSYRNLRSLGMRRRYGTGWAIGAWFVPFLNLVRPKKIANDIWRESDPDIDTPVRELGVGPLSALLNWWWAAYLGSSILDNIASTAVNSSQTEGSLHDAYVLALVSDVGDVVAAVVAIYMVRRMTARQSGRRTAVEARLATQAPASA